MNLKLLLACVCLVALVSAANGCAVHAHWQCENFPHAFGATRAIGNDFRCHDQDVTHSTNVGALWAPVELPLALTVDLLQLPYVLLVEPDGS